jgi:4-aminobutyrate aminotransferase
MTAPQALTDAAREVELAAYADDQDAVAGVEHLRFFPLVVASGHGCTLVTPAGRELLDFSASWTASAFGHGNPAIADAVHAAALRGAGASVLSSAVSETTRLAQRLVDLVPVRLAERAYLGLGGTDANTVAIAVARSATGRAGILSFSGSYHGGHGPSAAVSGMGVEPGASAHGHVLEFPVDAAGLERVAGELAAALAPRETAAVVVEAVQCDGGVRVPPADFLPLLRRACDDTGTLLIVDEVKAGLGRTGRLFAFEASGIEPDLVTLGKSLGGGLPISAVVGPEAALGSPRASALLTTAGSPVPVAAAHAVLDLLADGALARNAAGLEAPARQQLAEARAAGRPGAAAITEVRGRGLLLGVEFGDAGGSTGAELAALTVYRAWELGCVLYVVRDNVLEITPPLGITAAELEAGLDVILRAADDAVAGGVPRSILTEFGGW